MRAIKRYCSQNAFSLIEVILAIVILETIAVAMLGMVSFGNRAALINEENLKVVNLLQRKAEEIKCRDFDTDFSEIGFTYTGYTNYLFTVTQTVPWLGNAALKKIDVVVSWTNPLGVPKSEPMTFLMGDY